MKTSPPRPAARAYLSRAVLAATTVAPRISHDLVKAAHSARSATERQALLASAERACRELLAAVELAGAAGAGGQPARRPYRAPRLYRLGRFPTLHLVHTARER